MRSKALQNLLGRLVESGIEIKYSDAPAPRATTLIPMVIEETTLGEQSYDIYSRLLKDQILFIGTAIDDHVANLVPFLEQIRCADQMRSIRMPERGDKSGIPSEGATI